MQYLTTWRMVKATELLRESRLGLKEVAAQVGYESEVSFSKAFKRWAGVAPVFIDINMLHHSFQSLLLLDELHS